MTALAQGGAGLALVMGFGLLRVRQLGAAAILLAVQSAAIALAAMALHRPMLALPPLVLGGGVWIVHHRMTAHEVRTAPVNGAAAGILIATALAVLCQSQGALALPLAIILMAILLAAIRPHPLMHLIALVAIQNGITLAGCPSSPDALVSIAGFVLPLPLAAGLMILAPSPVSSPAYDGHRRLAVLDTAKSWLARPSPAMTRRTSGRTAHAPWFGWIQFALSIAMFAGALTVPLDPLGSIFTPLIAIDGVLRAWSGRERTASGPSRRGAALLGLGCMLLAVATPNPIVAWLAVTGAIATALLPILERHPDRAVLAFCAAGLSLFGLVTIPAAPSIIGYMSLFAGYAMIAAVVPNLAVVLVILILRLANQAPWPPAAGALAIGIAVVALLACAFLLMGQTRRHRATLLQLGQASIAALTIGIGQPDGRFAAVVLLILLILTRAATRITEGPAATIAMAGLGGIPPFGVFPGLVLVVLSLSGHDPWLLLPLGVALIPMLLAGIPSRLSDVSPRAAVLSVGWVPLVLTLLFGLFTPDALTHWLRMLTAGRP
ncbi:MAG: hypothetical protein P4L90_06645 [Rhodopila sp.]|nr:hypothetical protein [Rhodopila sp.]